MGMHKVGRWFTEWACEIMLTAEISLKYFVFLAKLPIFALRTDLFLYWTCSSVG